MKIWTVTPTSRGLWTPLAAVAEWESPCVSINSPVLQRQEKAGKVGSDFDERKPAYHGQGGGLYGAGCLWGPAPFRRGLDRFAASWDYRRPNAGAVALRRHWMTAGKQNLGGDAMRYRFRGLNHPEANGRSAEPNEVFYVLEIKVDDHRTVVLELGEEDLQTIHGITGRGIEELQRHKRRAKHGG